MQNVFTGTSGISKQRSSDQTAAVPPSYLLLKSIGTKYEDIRSDTKLSSTSLNSNSSGSSSNSSESNPNKNPISTNMNGEQWEGKPWINSSENSLNVNSTPSESTSELSVLSSNTLVSPVNIPVANKKGSMLLSMRPSSSTGAIPKSISFDMSADKGYRDFDDDSRCSKRGSFFGKLKMGFRNRRGKPRDDYNNVRFDCADDDGRSRKSEYPRIGASVANSTGGLFIC